MPALDRGSRRAIRAVFKLFLCITPLAGGLVPRCTAVLGSIGPGGRVPSVLPADQHEKCDDRALRRTLTLYSSAWPSGSVSRTSVNG